jgi:hypothetical protein
MCEPSGSDLRQMQGIDHNEGQGAHNNASEPWFTPTDAIQCGALFQDHEASEFMDDSMYDNEGQGPHNNASESWSPRTPTRNAINDFETSFQGLGPMSPSGFYHEASEFIDYSMCAPALDNGDFLSTDNDVHASTDNSNLGAGVETAIGGCDSVICPLFRQNPYLHFHCLDEGKLRYISYLL